MYSLFILASTSAALAFLLTPLCRNLFHRHGWVDRPDARKTHQIAVPRVGGIPIAIAYVASLALLLAVPGAAGDTIRNGLPAALRYLPAAALILLAGFADDVIGLRPWAKLAGQLAAGALAIRAGVEIHGIGSWIMPTWLSIPVTLLWLTACSNAFNLIDGIDGLAAGAGLFATVTTLTAAFMQHNRPLILVTVPLAGALLGFLRYNFNPASIFLGDCGSLLVGFLVGCFGILWSQKSATAVGMTAPLLAFAIPLVDTLVSMARRLLRRQPIFKADREHIHHKLLQRGLSPKRVVLLMYAACGLSAALSLVLSGSHDRFAGIVVIVSCAAAWLGVQHLGYAEFSVARGLMAADTYRRLINSHLALRAFEERLNAATGADQIFSAVRATYREFGFHEIEVCIDGRSFAERTIDGGVRSWSARISLPGSGSVTLIRRADSDVPPIMAPYVDALSSSLRRKLSQTSLANLAAAVATARPAALPAANLNQTPEAVSFPV